MYTRNHIRTDRNGTQYFDVTHSCGKCGGTGIVDIYVPVNGGVCFDCNGSGIVRYTEKVFTEEYLAKKAAKDAAKAKAKREKEILSRYPEGVVYMIVGNTYGNNNKAKLKACGARYNSLHHWHSGHEIEGFRSIAIPVGQAFRKLDDGTLDPDDPLEVEIVDPEAVVSQYVGGIGDKLDVEVRYSHRVGYERRSFSGRGYEMHNLYFFDANGNVLVWDTAAALCNKDGDFIEEGMNIRIKASVKAHREYKDTKQTMLTRVRVA